MRIISKTHDFYDSAMAQGADRSLVYTREMREAEGIGQDIGMDLSKAPFESRVYDDRHHAYVVDDGFYPNVLLFCGKAYPFFEHDERSYMSWPALGLQINHLWSAGTMHATMQRRLPPHLLERYDSRRRVHGTWFGRQPVTRQTVDEFFDFRFSEATIAAIHYHVGSPIIRYGISRSTQKPFTVVDPVLRDIGFAKVMDPFAAFQELSMYLGGVMRGTENPMVSISDKDRIAKHGFDRWSFRKKVR